MIEIEGKFNVAKVFTDSADSTTLCQVKNLCDLEYLKDRKIRLMPDCHSGKGAIIGTSMTIGDKVCPYTVGSDIGCGMRVVVLKEGQLDLECLDKCIRRSVPYGFSVRKKEA